MSSHPKDWKVVEVGIKSVEAQELKSAMDMIDLVEFQLQMMATSSGDTVLRAKKLLMELQDWKKGIV